MAAPTIPVMAVTLEGLPIRSLTADDVMAMVDHGILGEDERVELLYGVLTEVSGSKPPHAVVIQRLNRWLAPLMVAGTHDVRVQLVMVVPDRTSLPVPDVVVIERSDVVAHPTTAPLVIEVAHTSHRVDMKLKVPLYASAGVPEYWVVDVKRGGARIFRDPVGDRYGSDVTVGRDAILTPAHVDAAPLALSELLAGT